LPASAAVTAFVPTTGGVYALDTNTVVTTIAVPQWSGDFVITPESYIDRNQQSGYNDIGRGATDGRRNFTCRKVCLRFGSAPVEIAISRGRRRRDSQSAAIEIYSHASEITISFPSEFMLPLSLGSDLQPRSGTALAKIRRKRPISAQVRGGVAQPCSPGLRMNRPSFFPSPCPGAP